MVLTRKSLAGFARKSTRTERRIRVGATPRDVKRRKPLTKPEREAILAKTGGRCHICGGAIEEDWEADHVFAHAQGGAHTIDNYLPAHPLCNNYRWYYGTEEFQWILKLGVWWRTQVEHEEPLALREEPRIGMFHREVRLNVGASWQM